MKCRVKFCRGRQGSRQLLCSEHWMLVPEDLKNQIWEEYRPGQTRQTATTRYWRLAAQAIKIATRRDEGGDLDRKRHQGADIPDRRR